MTNFDLLTNYVKDSEALMRRTRVELKKVLALESEDNQTRRSLTPVFETMSSPLQLRPVSILDQQSMLETMDLNSSQRSSIWCKLSSFAERHMKMRVLITNLEIYSTFTIKGVSRDAILLRLFPFSLLGKAKQWFYANKHRNTTWENCSTAFLGSSFS
jgi:hypothetical protein